MGTFFLEKGLVIQRLGQILEFSSRAGKELNFEEPDTGKWMTIKESHFWAEFQTHRIKIVDAFSAPNILELPKEPPAIQTNNLLQLPQEIQKDTIRRLFYINKLKEAGITCGQTLLIKTEAIKIHRLIGDKKNVPGTSTIQTWWRKYEKQQYTVFALVTGHAARKRAIRIDEESEEFVQNVIDEKYAVIERPTALGAYRSYLTELKKENFKREQNNQALLSSVSERTFYARIAKRSKEEMYIARFGREQARHHFRMIRGHLPADHPLDVAEIDHTPLNIYVIDDSSFLPLGRPWLTAIKDRKSGVLLGFYISFQATGLTSIFGGLKNSLTAHNRVHELWPDIINPLPFGRAHYYASDRGADFGSPHYQSAITSINSLYEYCERHTPWLKGSIERFFLTLEQTFFEAMPGRTFANYQLRGDYKPEKDAVIRFSVLVYLIHKWAADFHNVFPNKRKHARPIDIWNEGIQYAPPPYVSNVDELNIVLGQQHTGTLSHEGIRFQWLNYADEGLKNLMEQIGKGQKVKFYVSSEDLGSIHVINPRNSEFIRVSCTRPDYANGLSLFQHKYLIREANIRLSKSNCIELLCDTRDILQEKILNEIELKGTARKAELAKISGINSAAVLEKKQRTILDPFQNQSENQEIENVVSLQEEKIIVPFTNIPRYQWGI